MLFLSGMILLLFSASPLSADTVFPSGFCESLSKPAPEKIAPYLTIAPELEGVKNSMREVTFEKMDPLLAEAVARGWSAVDFFSEDAIRGQCLYFISKEALNQVHAKYNLHVLTKIKGTDTGGQPFQMNAMFTGLSDNFMFYNRDSFTIQDGDRQIRLRQKVRERVPGAGRFIVTGMSVYVSQLGTWWDINTAEKKGSNQMEIRAGPFNIAQTVSLSPITIRQPSATKKKKIKASAMPVPAAFGQDFDFQSKQLKGVTAIWLPVRP
ncbi:MAG: hypothetical protein HY747_11510 [Elusimicrobia bacterium]|nr:hypothetical protein [Elusimicrobiota bacterium]